MAQPNLKSEPSMEEILASIRQIIESNDAAEAAETAAKDTVAKATQADTDKKVDEEIAPDSDGADDSGPATAQAPKIVSAEQDADVFDNETTDEAPEVSGSETMHADVHALESGANVSELTEAKAAESKPTEVKTTEDKSDEAVTESPALQDAPEAAQAPAAKPVRLSEIAARVQAASAAARLNRAEANREPEKAPLRPAPSNSDAPKADAPAQEAPVFQKPAEKVAQPEPSMPEAVSPKPAPAPETQQTAAPDQNQLRQTASEQDGQRAGAQLISVDAGAKVAAAFEDLSEAFQAGSRRTFDEIAEDMLRPMLTEWLDDNLPTLVERLVREEIERVARGNRH